MKIKVTAKDIKLGKQEDCRRCPVARAMRRASGKIVEVDHTCGYLDYNSARLPPEARAFIRKFDEGKKVVPFTFEVNWRER